jgi:hypothetical protein
MLDRDAAEKLSILTMQVSEKLNESVAFVRDHDSKESYESYARVAATLVATLYLDIQERLWRDYPDLRPKGMKNGTYEVDPRIFEPRFYTSTDKLAG